MLGHVESSQLDTLLSQVQRKADSVRPRRMQTLLNDKQYARGIDERGTQEFPSNGLCLTRVQLHSKVVRAVYGDATTVGCVLHETPKWVEVHGRWGVTHVHHEAYR